MEHVLRQCLIALRIADRQGLDPQGVACAYWTSLLVNVGCHTDAHEQAKWFGDDLALKSDKYDHDLRSVRAAISGVRRIGSGSAPLHRFRLGLEFVLSGHREVDDMIAQHAAMARQLADQLDLPPDVLEALGASYEQWDGRGWPGALRGEAVPLASRIAQLAEFVEVANRNGGLAAVQRLARQRGGKQFDPALTSMLQDDGEEVLEGLDEIRSFHEVVSAEPALAHVLDDEELDAALRAIADFVDIKSPYTLGHAGALSALVGEAAGLIGLSP